MKPSIRNAAAPKTEFQVVLEIVPPNADTELEDLAILAVEALADGAAGLALGPAAMVDFDERLLRVELTVEAASASEVHQKIGLIIGALERGAAIIMMSSNTSRSSDRELACA